MTTEHWCWLIGGICVALIVTRDAWGRNKPSRPEPGTKEDPRVARMVDKQEAYGVRMKRKGQSILNPKKPYTAAVHQAPSLRTHAKLLAIRGGKR